MQITINLENTVAAALEKALSAEVVRTKVEEALDKVVDSAIKDAFSPYGDFAKVVKQSIAGLVPHSVDIEGAANFNHGIKQAITTRLKRVNDERISQAISPMLDELLEPMPAEITLSELIKQAMVHWSDDYHRHGADRPYIHVEETTGIVAGYHHIHLDPDGNKQHEYGFSRYNAAIQIDVNDNGEVYGLKVSGDEAHKRIFAGPFFGFERMLFNLYTCKTRLVVDAIDFSEVSYTDESLDG